MVEYSDIYLGMRNVAITTKAEDIGVEVSDDSQVFASIVDMKLDSGIVTLACVFDGTVSLYYSDGKVDIGLGQKEKIKKIAMSFLFSSGQCLSAMTLLDAVPPPSPENIDVFLATRAGIYFTKVKQVDDIKENQFLNFLIQSILNAIRLNNN